MCWQFYAMKQRYGATRVLSDLATRNKPAPAAMSHPQVKKVERLNKPEKQKICHKIRDRESHLLHGISFAIHT